MALFRPKSVKFQLDRRSTEEDKTAHCKISALVGGKKWNCSKPSERLPQVFLSGALLGRAGHHLVLHLSVSWGDLKPRISLLENVLA
jgi:hypothetical protein